MEASATMSGAAAASLSAARLSGWESALGQRPVRPVSGLPGQTPKDRDAPFKRGAS